MSASMVRTRRFAAFLGLVGSLSLDGVVAGAPPPRRSRGSRRDTHARSGP